MNQIKYIAQHITAQDTFLSQEYLSGDYTQAMFFDSKEELIKEIDSRFGKGAYTIWKVIEVVVINKIEVVVINKIELA